MDIQKIGHMAAYLLLKEGEPMEGVKLQRLMYLADRDCISTFGYSMSGDEYVVLPLGGVAQKTVVDVMRGEKNWYYAIETTKGGYYTVNSRVRKSHLDHLSRANEENLTRVWNWFGDLHTANLINVCGRLPESRGKEPGSIVPVEEVLMALGFSKRHAKLSLAHIDEGKKLDKFFGADK